MGRSLLGLCKTERPLAAKPGPGTDPGGGVRPARPGSSWTRPSPAQQPSAPEPSRALVPSLPLSGWTGSSEASPREPQWGAGPWLPGSVPGLRVVGSVPASTSPGRGAPSRDTPYVPSVAQAQGTVSPYEKSLAQLGAGRPHPPSRDSGG